MLILAYLAVGIPLLLILSGFVWTFISFIRACVEDEFLRTVVAVSVVTFAMAASLVWGLKKLGLI
jgi:hypothetical protein